MTGNNTGYESASDFYDSYLRAEDFTEEGRQLTIEHIERETTFNPKTTRSEENIVIYFEGVKRGYIIKTATNRKFLEKLYTTKMDNWIGKDIILYRATISMLNKPTPAIRFREPNKTTKSKNTKRATIEQLEALQRLIDDGVITNTSAMLSYYKVAQIEELSEKDAAEIIKKKSNTEEDF